MIDLRSDTLTRPTPAMRAAMAEAEVGDDGYSEDPTVRRLEEASAALLGTEAALFVVSGTMANQVALRTLAAPGALVLVGARAHLCQFERGASARNALVQLHTLDDTSGAPEAAAVHEVVADYLAIGVKPALLAIENTHMPSGGVPIDADRTRSLAKAAGSAALYVDGARIANAAVALGADPAELAAAATLVSMCFSKGLGAPMGSVLAGPRELIERARAERQALGGRLRQAGIVAAAALVALDGWREVLARDHERARTLADVLAEGLGRARVAWGGTNMVLLAAPDAPALVARLRSAGVAANAIGARTVRFVTHRDLDDGAIVRAAERIVEVAR